MNFIKTNKNGASPTTDGAPFLLESSSKRLLATFQVLLMLSTNVVIQSLNLLFVELDIIIEQVHTIEAINGSRISYNIRPVPDSDILGTIKMQCLVVNCQKKDETELKYYHEECNQETESAEVLRQPHACKSVHRPVP